MRAWRELEGGERGDCFERSGASNYSLFPFSFFLSISFLMQSGVLDSSIFSFVRETCMLFCLFHLYSVDIDCICSELVESIALSVRVLKIRLLVNFIQILRDRIWIKAELRSSYITYCRATKTILY